MVDVTPELLEKIKNQFNQEYEKSSSIKGVLNKIEKGNATYEDANDYAREIGEILSGALTDNLSSDVLPDGKMYYNIANEIFNDVLGNNYELATNVSASVQQVLNEKSGIGLKAITPNVDQDRIDSIVGRISNEDLFDNIKWIVGEPIVNFTQSAVNETIKQNSEFQYDAGLRPKIVRKLGGKCCEWCAKLVGEYAYPDVPKDVYRRHNNCRCTVEYVEGSMRTNVHTKKTYVEEHSEEVKDRIEQATSNKKFEPAKTIKDAEKFISQYVDKNQFFAQGVSYSGMTVGVANRINKTISDFFDLYDKEKIGGVLAPKRNSKLGRHLEENQGAMAFVKIGKSFIFDRDIIKNEKSVVEYFANTRLRETDIFANPKNYDFNKFSEITKRCYENGKISKRMTYPSSIEQAMNHELGHFLQEDVYASEKWSQIEQNMVEYAKKVSGYACESKSEYIAESFSAYMNKDYDIIDPILKEVFEGLKKK